MVKVGRKRKFFYLFGEKWNEGKENAEFSIGPTFSFSPKLEGNREKRESVLEHEDFFFLSFLPCKPNTSNARYSHFFFLLFVSTKINFLKLVTQNFNLVICNHENGYNHHRQMKHYMISYNHILNIHQINFIQNPTEWSSTVGRYGA